MTGQLYFFAMTSYEASRFFTTIVLLHWSCNMGGGYSMLREGVGLSMGLASRRATQVSLKCNKFCQVRYDVRLHDPLSPMRFSLMLKNALTP